MSGSDLQGRWMPSSVTEEDVLKLREAKYLAYEISHRLPAEGQAIPTPEPGEYVVFVSHLRRGLGFPMDPFVRGLMFYYGLEFHDLAPESILHISAFIVVCEAFLRVTPHFGLWLKTFNVAPKMIGGRQAECGGAAISRRADAPWPAGSFQEELGPWQQEWFYITVPRGRRQKPPPLFRPGPPRRLMSWVNQGLNWGPSKDVPLLQGRIRDLQTREVDMVVVMQVMLIRRLPPCKRRPLRLWEFNPEGPRILQHFMGMTPLEMYKLFFGSQEARPELTEDAGLSCNRPDTQVSSSKSGHTVCLPFDDSPYDQLPSKQEWIAEAKLIWCPAPLPETAPDSVLVRMLEVAPPEEGEGESRKATASPKEALERGGIENPSLQGEKRTASEDPGAKAPKRGKKSSPEGPASGEAPAAQSPFENQPSNEP